MAIIPTTQNKVALYAAGLYGMKLGSATNSAVLFDVQNNPSGVNGVLNGYYAPFASMTSAQVAAIVVANVGIKAGQYGLTAQNVADAVATVTAELNAAAPFGKQGETIANVLTDFTNTYESNAVYGAAAKAWNVKIAQAVSYTGNSQFDAAFGEIVTEFRLTGAENENRNGTAGDDIFTAVQGAFNSTDRVNGGDGFDTLKAQVSGVVAPSVSNVEHLQFQAQHRTADSGDNNVADEQVVKVDFNTNVTNITGFNTIENSNSRADLIVEDVRIANNQITKDITVVMRETDPGNVDYGVYFDQNSLRNVSTSTSQINLRVLDTYNTSLGNAPLKGSPYGAFTFSYSLDGAAPVSVKLESDAIQNAQTFPEMVAALQAAADAKFGAGVVTVSLGSTYTVPDSVTGVQVQGTELVMAAKGNISFSTPAGSGWLATEVVPAVSGLHTSYTLGGSQATELVTSTIILDDVGRGSTGGDLVVGGLSVGETSTSKGVQKFLIEVQDNSKLQTINSTNNTLQEVVIVNGVTTRVNNAYNENEKNAGSLTVRGIEQPNDGFGNNTLPGADTLAGAGINHGAFGFTDVRLVDASAMTGKLDIDAQITSRSVAKYLNLKDVNGNPAADNISFDYLGGSNNDKIAVVVDGEFLASRTLTGREDFKLNVSGGSGNDVLTVDIGTNGVNAENGQWRVDQFALRNVSINGGDGNDTINSVGTGYFNIEAGTGNDTVYVDNTGTKATWVVAAANTQVSNLQTAANALGRSFLYKGKATVTFSAGNESGLTAAMANALDNGFEVTVDVPTGDNYAVTQFYINQAIKNAVNSNAVLNKLLSVTDGPGTSLVVTSLVDGSVVAGDLQIRVTGTDLTALPASEQASVLEAFKNFDGNSAATLADAIAAEADTVVAANAVTGVGATVIGTDDLGVAIGGAASSAHNDGVINAGAGDDVVVLSTGAFSNNVVKFTGYDQGMTTIVNFNNLGAGADRLDFSSYMVGKASPSGSALSQVIIPTTLNADILVEANSISVLNLVVNPAKAADNFANLTAEKLLASINSTNTGLGDYANLNAGTLNANTGYTASGVGTTLVGGIGKAVVLVHNEANDGQYKAFEVTFNGTAAANATADFTSAQLIGTFDLGETMADLAAALLTNTTSAAEGAGPGPGPGPVLPTPVAVADLQTYDASTGAFAYTLDFAAAGVKLANINGFGADDTIVLSNPIAGSTQILDSSAATSLDFVVGDTAGFSNAWAVQLGALDAALVTSVVAAGDGTAGGFGLREAVLDTAWGADWFGG